MKEMAWLPRLGDEQKILHLRVNGGAWQPYNSSPYGVPDYLMPKGSKGFATYQKLRLEGWVLIPFDQARTMEAVADAAS